MSERRLSLAEVEELSARALRGAGATAAQAGPLARAVAAAERDGIRSHGLAYVPIYCEHLRCGKVAAGAEPTLSRPRPSAIVVDAADGFAHPAIELGFSALLPAARELGCAGLALRNSYNCGTLGYHVERIAAEGLLGLGFTNAPASIAPVGGKRPVIGTNPFALAVPDGAGGTALVIDQSASVIAKSEIMLRAREGGSIPDHWALDPDGRSTSDPAAALAGSMAPSGGHKGFGVGLMVELFAAALAGATLGKDASAFSGTAGGPPRTGQFFLAVDPESYSGGLFAARRDALLEAISGQPGARLPGARRFVNRARFEREGVLVPTELLDRILAFA
jgi:(2R)-3-sulfolactate dehydrogenase (NADP+)